MQAVFLKIFSSNFNIRPHGLTVIFGKNSAIGTEVYLFDIRGLEKL